MNIWMFLMNKKQIDSQYLNPGIIESKLKKGFEPKSFKNYSLTPQEQIEMEIFLAEILEKGYIQFSKSPMASPFFFVNKKRWKTLTNSRLPVLE